MPNLIDAAVRRIVFFLCAAALTFFGTVNARAACPVTLTLGTIDSDGLLDATVTANGNCGTASVSITVDGAGAGSQSCTGPVCTHTFKIPTACWGSAARLIEGFGQCKLLQSDNSCQTQSGTSGPQSKTVNNRPTVTLAMPPLDVFWTTTATVIGHFQTRAKGSHYLRLVRNGNIHDVVAQVYYENNEQDVTWTPSINLSCQKGPQTFHAVAMTCGAGGRVIGGNPIPTDPSLIEWSTPVVINIQAAPTATLSIPEPGPTGQTTATVSGNFPYRLDRKRYLRLFRNGNIYDVIAQQLPPDDLVGEFSFPVSLNFACTSGTTRYQVAAMVCGAHYLVIGGNPVPSDPDFIGYSAEVPMTDEAKPDVSITTSTTNEVTTGLIAYEFPSTTAQSQRDLTIYFDDGPGTTISMAAHEGTHPVTLAACWKKLRVVATACDQAGNPAFTDEAVIENTLPAPSVSITGFDKTPEGTYALVAYSFPQTTSSLQRHLELRRSHTDALIAEWYATQQSGIWPVLMACDPGVPVYATAKACSDPPVKSADAMPPECELSCSSRTMVAPAASCCIGDPVHTTSGNMEFSDQDPLPGGMVAPLARTYQSRNPASGAFGTGWTTIMDARATALGGTDGRDGVFLVMEDGRRAMFRRSSGVYVQTYPEDSTAAGTLVFDAARNGFVHRDSGSSLSRVFRASDGRLASIVDSRGDEVILTYDGNGKATSIADEAGRWSWAVTYGAAGVVQSIAVAGEPGLVWTYAYSSGKLATVTAPGSAVWRTYVYGAAGLEEIRDARGAVTERHEYDGAGRARSSFGPSGELTDIQFNLAGRVSGESRTHVISADGKTIDYYSRFIAGKMRTVEVAGSCNCGSDDSVFAHDDAGHVLREQNNKGWVTVRTFANGRVAMTSTLHRPAGCDPQTDTSRCRQTPDSLATVALQPTAASVTTTFAYGDPNWPERPTLITTDSVVSGQQRQQASTFDPLTGTVLTETSSGFDPVTSAAVQRTTQTTLYNGTEGAAFNPCAVNPSGCAFSTSWLGLPQPAGHAKSVNGPRTDVADVSEFVYYPIDDAVPPSWRGRLAAVRNAAGQIVRQEDYDLFGNARHAVSANGSVTESAHDLLGRNLTTTLKGAPGCDTAADALCATDIVSRRMYDPPAGPLAIQIGPRGEATSYTYDDRGRTIEVVRGGITGSIPTTAAAAIAAATWLEKLETQYSATTGRKTTERILGKESGSWVQKRTESYAYDVNGRLSTVTHADGTSRQYAYDAGEIQSVRDENHTSPNTFYSYDAAGRIATVRQTLASAAGGEVVTSYSYDRNGNLTSVTDPNGNVTTYLYDDFGRMVRQISPVSGQTSYAYDAAGQLLSTTDANSATTTRTFDLLGRVLSASSARAGSSETVSWTYDAGAFGIGRMTGMTDPSGTSTYQYDRRGLLIRETKEVTGASASYITSFSYDAAGNRSSVTYPSGTVVSYTFDHAGRPVGAATGSTSLVTSATYLPFGPVTEIVHGNGTTKAMTYDQRYRPLTNALAGASGTIASYAYGYDAAGNVTSIEDDTNATYDRTFGYDDLNRLTSANGGSSLWGTGSYTYDAMGNLQTLALGTSRAGTFTYSGTTPKLSSVTENGQARTVTYDAAGNEIAAGAATSGYSPRNHLVSSGLTTYRYDGRDVRTTTIRPFTLSAPQEIIGGQSASGTLTLPAAAPAGGYTVSLSSSNTAHLSVPATVTVAAGSVAATFTIGTTAVPANTSVTITAAAGTMTATATVVVKPLPWALASLTIDPDSVGYCEGETTGTVTLAAAAPAGGARVLLSHDYSYEIPEWYLDRPLIPDYVDVSAGQTVATFTIFPYVPQCENVFPGTCDEDITITGTLGGTKSADVHKGWVCAVAELAIFLDDTEIRSGADIRGSVKLRSAAPQGGASITLQFGAETELVTVPEGQQTGRFALPSPRTRRRERMVVKAEYQGARGAASIDVIPGGLALVLPRTAIGGETLDGTVELMEPAPRGGARVRLRSVAAAVDESALVSDGQSSVPVRIATPTVSEPREVTITASVDGMEAEARVLLEPATVSLSSCEITPSSVRPGSVVQGLLTLSAAAPAGGIAVRIHANDGTVSLPDVVFVPGGALVASFEIAVTASAGPGVVVITATLNGVPCITELVIAGKHRAGRPISWLRRLFDDPESKSSLSLAIGARFTDPVTDTGGTDMARHSLYSPELQLLAETTTSSGPTPPPIAHEYVWFGGQPLAQIETATGDITWYFNDHLGTPILQTDATAAVVWRAEYEPYGSVFALRTGASKHQPLRFPGQEEEGETSYNIFRWYRAGWGRYTQADPIGLEGGLNLYGYTPGNPITRIDPFGLESPPDLAELAKQLVCCVLERKINDALRELGRRIGQEEQMQRLLGEEVFSRSLFENFRQYLGHRQAYTDRQKNLRKLLKQWERSNCGPPPPSVGDWATRRYPGIGYIYEIAASRNERVWQDLNWWAGGYHWCACN